MGFCELFDDRASSRAALLSHKTPRELESYNFERLGLDEKSPVFNLKGKISRRQVCDLSPVIIVIRL